MDTLTFHVCPTGHDANPGTLDAPFRTLHRARDAAREKREHVPTDLHWRDPQQTGRNDQLFYRGRRMQRSRYPKFDPAQPGRRGAWAWPSEVPAEDAYRRFFLPKDWPQKYARPDEGELNMAIGHGGWCNNLIPIEAIDAATGLLTVARDPMKLGWTPWAMQTPFTTSNRFFIENLREDLTAPGEPLVSRPCRADALFQTTGGRGV